MLKDLIAQPLTKEAFAPFGDVFEPTGTPDKIINGGGCKRFHNQAKIDIADNDFGISLFDSKTYSMPYLLGLMERHPLGSQSFTPMSVGTFLVTVAEDADGIPVNLRSFYTAPFQSINIHRNIWHGPLVPLSPEAVYVVMDYIGTKPNLEEYTFDKPYQISLAHS